MARRKAKSNVKKTTVSATAASTKVANNSIKDDPGGRSRDELKSSQARATAVILNRTNVGPTKDQQVTTAAPLIAAPVTSTSTNTTNDSKYLHKKFKKFCATVDSNSHSREPTPASNVATSDRDRLLNNNSEIVENKNSWTPANVNEDLSLRNNHFQSVPSPPKHSLTTEEEKQLVKDIIDINNENFMHQSANQLSISQNTSSYLITPIASGSQFVTVTTLGNHNSNFQPADHRHKPSNHQEVLGSFSQTPNGNFVIINNQTPADLGHQQPTTISTVPTTASGSTPGRYICPYCQLNCAKPSVLQKHIRAHTNERPYPCTLCGFAFKTKSNLYKHCRSRAHIQRCNGETDPTVALIASQNDEDGCSLESGDIDEADSTQLETMNRLSSPSIVMESQINGHFGENSSSSSSNSSAAYPANSSSDTSSAAKPYKPKFHNYKKLDLSKTMPLVTSTVPAGTGPSTPSTPSTPSFFSTNAGQLTPQIIEERISKIISDNEAIIDKVEALLQKKYHKITGIQRHLSTSASATSTSFSTTDAPLQSNSKLALALLKQQQQQKQHDEEILRYQMSTQQPLNLIKIHEPLTVDVGTSASNATPRKRYLNENPAPLVITSSQPPPQPETVVEKPQSTQLVIPASHPQNPEGSIIKDLLLNSKNFGAVDGETGDGSYTCPTCKLSFRGADILKYHLICHCQGEENILSRSAPMSPASSTSSHYYQRSNSEKRSPTSLIQLAQTQLRASTSKNPSSLQKLAKSQLKPPKHKPENIMINASISAIKPTINHQAVIKNPLPSPGPLLGNTRLVEKRAEEEFGAKKPKLEFPTSLAEAKMSTLFGGDMKIFNEKILSNNKNFSSGGTLIAVEGTSSGNDNIKEASPNMMRQGLSGGIALELKKESPTTPSGPPPITPKLFVTITPTLAPTLTTNSLFTSGPKSNHFQFPSSIAAYNPLTLPLMSTGAPGTQSIVHGGRTIPYVPGIPGPNTLSMVNKNDLPPPPVPIKDKRLNSPSLKQNGSLLSPRDPSQIMPRPNGVISRKKSFNFARIADNIEAKKNLEIQFSGEGPEEGGPSSQQEVKPSKPAFLRPTTLPLKPGTFTPKQHHGITPTANTLPLISPETPRPSKSCVQLYLNGHAYTYLGLKSSTKTFYCTVNKPQPVYIQNQHKLSMYSNWQIYTGNNPNIFDLSPYTAMSLYDSRQRQGKLSVAESKADIVTLVEMQDIKVSSTIAPSNYQIQQFPVIKEENPALSSSGGSSLTGHDNSEEYTYIRGRGRGKYVCQECGIRCKKPSMLKKHIRTHTDLRPYTCSHCEFSFKTKGNLTKHMKSKAHFKKCSELGISPIPTMPDDDMADFDESMSSHSRNNMTNGRENDGRDDSETDSNDSDEDIDDESGDDTDESKSRMPEHEAAQLLLSLSNHAASTSSTQTSANQHISMANVNWNEQTDNGVDAMSRKRVVLSVQKSGDFDLLNHEKYYSDPNLRNPKENPVTVQSSVDDDCDDAVPMDLTKKPAKSEQRVVRVTDVISKFSEPAVLLNQLVSNIDKMPANSIGVNMNFTDNIQYNESLLPQEYITERALKDDRMKQSQRMNKSNEYHQAIISMVNSKDHLTTTSEDLAIFNRQAGPAASKNGLMDTLADLASKSDKLEVKESISTVNAKSVASEYLKLTQQKILRPMEGSNDGMSDQESQEAPAILLPQNIVVGEDGFHKKVPTSMNISNDQLLTLQDDTGRPICVVCSKVFQKASQLKLHMNIHYMERKFRCDACGVSFRTQGHLQKHERSVSHQNKVNMTSSFGTVSPSNPRPFSCKECMIAFRIHGHLAKHLRSKMHVLKLECLQKLPFGTYAEMERSGFNLTDIDTSDCEKSLMSLRQLAVKLRQKDPSKLGELPPLKDLPVHSDDFDENGSNENWDSDSSANYNEDDPTLKRKATDSEETESAKKVRISAEREHLVPSNPSPIAIKADD